MKNTIWKAEEFVKVNRPWGRFRRLVSKLDIVNGKAFIGLFRENDNGMMYLCVHQTANSYHVSKLPTVYVESESEIQGAVDQIFDALMAYKAG